MNTGGLTKINQLLQKLPSDSLFFSTWMNENGISYELQRHYRKSRWLTSLATGVMIRTGDKPTLFSALSCLYGQIDKRLHIGALSALELLGYSHFV
ncbi:MAG: AbiEi antitoxin N-terminal domain-containing protein, partial [Dysgonamonadaceae bacterium]|nr:AbiEi antitoxin N-terminal domain-containing protein [Dysgonamonadaceae bacterium]